MPFLRLAEETSRGLVPSHATRPAYGHFKDVAMRHRQVSHCLCAKVLKASVMRSVVVAAVLGSVASAQGRERRDEATALNWQSPVVRQTAGYAERDVAPSRQAMPPRDASTRIAMSDGEIVMDGGMMMFDEDSGFSGAAGISGGAITEPCTTCRTPPWHGNVAPPAYCGPGQCGPACDPCDPCQPCDPCDRPSRRSCFPRLQALFGEGYLASPIPPCEPRCRHCGAAVPVGF